MKRKHKLYSRPKRPFDKLRIEQEGEIKKEFGLKNKKEIWKAEARIGSIREKAKKLISADKEKQKSFFIKLQKIGLKVNSLGEVLSLEKKDYLKRRLQTILVEKKLASTPRKARQLIIHRKVFVGEKLVNSPSYIIPIEFENKISLKVKNNTKEKIKEKEKNE